MTSAVPLAECRPRADERKASAEGKQAALTEACSSIPLGRFERHAGRPATALMSQVRWVLNRSSLPRDCAVRLGRRGPFHSHRFAARRTVVGARLTLTTRRGHF